MWKNGRGLLRLRNACFRGSDCLQHKSFKHFLHVSQRASDSLSVQNNKWEFPSTYSDIIVPEGVTLSQFLFDKQEEFADRTLFVNGETGQSFSHQEIRRLSLVFGNVIRKLGFSSGEVLGLISPNCPEFAICLLGLISFGIVPTTISSSFLTDEINTQLKNSESVGIICHEENVNEVRSACKENSDIRLIISIGPEQDGVLSLWKLLKDEEKSSYPSQSKINPGEDMAILPYSSGTTGIPKGVMLTHRNIVANISQLSHPDVAIAGRSDGQDVVVGVLPLYHIYGLAWLFYSVYSGGQIVSLKKFDQHEYIKMIKKHKATILPVVPPLMNFLESNSIAKPTDLQSVQTVLCGAAPLGTSVVEKFKSKFGSHIDIMEGYGMTEASPVTHVTSPNALKRVSSGLLTAPSTIAKIVDIETELALQPNMEGELCIKGPQVMKGYINNEEATRRTIRDGWLHTGDIARMDENQHFFVVDRLKELIKVKGLQVAPAELENLLRLHPYVDDVAVIGFPDERTGEQPRAFVVCREDQKITEEELKEFVAKRVAPHKQISSVVFIKEIPKSAAGKILRKNLRNY